MTALGLLLMAILMLAGIGRYASHVIDIPSGIIVVGAMLGGLLMSFGSGVGTAIKAALGRTADPEALELSRAVFDRARSYTVGGSVLGTFIGLAIVLRIMDDPARLGNVIGIVLLTQIYGLLLAYGVLTPIVSALERRLHEVGPAPKS